MVKHNFWSVKGYLTKKFKKKKRKKKPCEKKILVKNLPNLLKNRVLGKKNKNPNHEKKNPNVL